MLVRLQLDFYQQVRAEEVEVKVLQDFLRVGYVAESGEARPLFALILNLPVEVYLLPLHRHRDRTEHLLSLYR